MPADTHTVSLMAEAETEEGVFEDVILGTYPSKRAALKAARDHVKANAEAQAQVFDKLPTDPAFTAWESIVAMVYREFDFGDEPTSGVITEAF